MTTLNPQTEAALRRLWDRLHDDEAHQLLATIRADLTAALAAQPGAHQSEQIANSDRNAH
jgi:hypothetical protein